MGTSVINNPLFPLSVHKIDEFYASFLYPRAQDLIIHPFRRFPFMTIFFNKFFFIVNVFISEFNTNKFERTGEIGKSVHKNN